MVRFLFACLAAICLLSAATQNADPKCLGTNTAPITVQLFSDYQCPTCRTLYIETITKMMTDCIASGQVYLVHHDFPLPMHQYAKKAALYANAAARVNKFETVSNELFQKQAVWTANGDIEAVLSPLLTSAEMTKMRQLIKDPAIEKSITSDVALGTQYGVQGTPTMIITRNMRVYPISGAISYPILKRFLDDLLTK